MRAVMLESFDEDAVADTTPDAGYDAGYAAGLAEGQAAAAAAQAQLQAEVVQTLADLNFTFVEAKQDILSALTPLFDQMIATLLPHCVATGFAGEIAGLMQTRLQEALDGGLTLTVHPDQVTAMQATFADTATRPRIASDPHLKQHEAWVGIGGTTTHLDLDTLCDEIGEILSAIHLAPERTMSHG